MGYLKKGFDFYINSSIHVAVNVCMLVLITQYRVGVEGNLNTVCFIFFATLAGYNFIKYFEKINFNFRKITPYLKAIQLVFLIGFIMMGYFMLLLPRKTLFLAFFLGLVTFLYAIPITPNKLKLTKNPKNLRNIKGIKIYIITLVWAMTTVVLPLLNSNIGISLDLIVYFFQITVFVFVLMLPFEIRDLKSDNRKISTIPQYFGIKNTKTIGLLLLFWCLFAELFITTSPLPFKWSMFITYGVTALLLFFATTNQNKYYSSFWVEGVPTLWFVILFFINLVFP